jgi:hypothetical protein
MRHEKPIMDGIQVRIYLLKHGDELARSRAATELQAYGAPAIRALCEEVTRLFQPSAVPEDLMPLLQLMVDPNPAHRIQAISGFAASPGDGALDALLSLARDGDSDVRRAAVKALGGKRDSRAFGVLKALVRDPDYQVPVLAVEALAQLGDFAAACLADIAKNAEYDRARKAALRALGATDSRFRTLALTEGLKDVDPEVRRAAALAIGRGRVTEALPQLSDMLADLPRVVEAVTEALVEIGDASVPHVCRALESKHGPTWSNALVTAHQLARRKPTVAMLPIWTRLKSMRWHFRGEARRLCAETLDHLEAVMPGADLPVPSKDPSALLPIPSSETRKAPSPDLPRLVDGA